MSKNMYDNAETWNPQKGCLYQCSYCVPTFQRQSKRWGKKNCRECYDFEPHFHPERLDRIPSSDIVFVCGSGDISFVEALNMQQIIDAMIGHYEKHPDRTFYVQTKFPFALNPWLGLFPPNVVILTTLESDLSVFGGRPYRDFVSRAPPPSVRAGQFFLLDYPRKGVTIEPVMDHTDLLAYSVIKINPEFVYIGFNTRPNEVELPEPSEERVLRTVELLQEAGIVVRFKDMRGIV